MDDASGRLSKLYVALETGKLDIDDLAPRIKELRAMQDQLKVTRQRLESKLATHNIRQLDAGMVKAFAGTLMDGLEEAELPEMKAMIRSLVSRIELDGTRVTLDYRLPVPPDGNVTEKVEVCLL
jgi:hypothetical protein